MPPQHQYDSKKILRDLESNNKFFDDLVDMIPAKLYVAGNTGDEMYNPKYRKGQHKESKEFRRARAKASFVKKFDPNLAETTRDTQRRLKEEEDDESDDDDDDNAGGDINDDDDDDDGHELPPTDDVEMSTKNQDQPAPTTSDSTTPPYQSRIELLRAKLRAKLDAKRGNQPSTNNNNNNDTDDNNNSALISKRAARRAAKQQRIETAKRRNQGGSTQTLRNRITNGKSNGTTGLTEEQLGGSKILSLTTADDMLSTIDYGGIAGLKDDIGANYTKSNKSLQNMGKKKSLERLLAEAAYNREKLDKLKASGELDDKERVKKVEWGKALKAADGTRTNKDDTAILKKAIKRKAKKKARSQQSWKTRMDSVKGKMDERQKIRQHNIGQRKLGGAVGANLSKKRIETEDGDGGGDGEKGGGGGNKRPRLGPHSGNAPREGFEGKKQGFINNKGGGKSSGGGGKKAQ